MAPSFSFTLRNVSVSCTSTKTVCCRRFTRMYGIMLSRTGSSEYQQEVVLREFQDGDFQPIRELLV